MKLLFKWFTAVGNDINTSIARIGWFTGLYDVTDFENTDKLLFCYLKFCSELRVGATREFLNAFLATDGKRCIKEYSIRLDSMDNFSYNEPGSLEEAFRIISRDAINLYEEYVSQDLEGRDFKVDVYTWMEEKKRKLLQDSLIYVFPKVQEKDVATSTIVDKLNEDLNAIKEKYDIKNIKKLDLLIGSTSDKDSHVASGKRSLFKTGLPCVDGDLGFVRSKDLISLVGQPGAGKTRIGSIHFAYSAAVYFGLGVLFDEGELDKSEVENIMIAHHIIQMYKGTVKIPDKVLNTPDQITDEIRRYYEAARYDLFESGKYGRIIIHDEPLVIEDVADEKTLFFKQNPDIQLWVIDYAGTTKSKPKNGYSKPLIKAERIEMLYETAKNDIAKPCDIAVFILNQYNREGIDAAESGKKILSSHIEGGQAVFKWADYHINMTMTEEQKRVNVCALSTGKVRSTKGFDNVLFQRDMSVSIFKQKQGEVKN